MTKIDLAMDERLMPVGCLTVSATDCGETFEDHLGYEDTVQTRERPHRQRGRSCFSVSYQVVSPFYFTEGTDPDFSHFL